MIINRHTPFPPEIPGFPHGGRSLHWEGFISPLGEIRKGVKRNTKLSNNIAMKPITFFIITATLFAGCRDKSGEADAFGTFEATEVTVSSETSGRILTFPVTEGAEIAEGEEIALIDTTLFHLQRNEIIAGMNGIRTKISSINAQNEILRQQMENLNVNVKRIENMMKDDAATKKQYDDLTGQVAVIEKQIAANNTQKSSVAAELSVYESKKATISEQLSRSIVKSPIK